jgi:topoisomerase-4 subunit B
MTRMAIKAGQPQYGEASIRVLKGLEPVKQRPGMYTRTESPLHVVQEVIDNAADEALAGAATAIDVTCTATARSASTTTAAAFRSGSTPTRRSASSRSSSPPARRRQVRQGGNAAYSFSGGLHGVGVSVTNALAKRLEVTVWRDGKVATIAFSGGDVVEALATRKAGAGERKGGTRVRVWPDPRYFESAELPRAELTHLLRSKAVLLPGVKVSLTVEKGGRGEPSEASGASRAVWSTT